MLWDETFSYIIICSQLQGDLSERAFLYFDKSADGVLTLDELYSGLMELLTGDKKTKLAFLFEMFDNNGRLWYQFNYQSN